MVNSLYGGPECTYVSEVYENVDYIYVNEDILLQLIYTDKSLNYIEMYFNDKSEDPEFNDKYSTILWSTFVMLSWGLGDYSVDTEAITGNMIQFAMRHEVQNFCGFYIHPVLGIIGDRAVIFYQIKKIDEAASPAS